MYTQNMSTSKSPSTKEINIDAIIIILALVVGLLMLIPLYQKNSNAINLRIKRLVARNTHVVILSTYGPTVQGSPFYESYIAKAMKYILDSKNNVNELIIVGGYTVDQNISQSQAVLNYIKEKYPAFITAGIPVTLDECGITTWQNIKNAKKLMDKEGISYKKLTIFAEESRKQKVAFFANGMFPRDTTMSMQKDEIIEEANFFANASKEAQLKEFAKPSKFGELSWFTTTERNKEYNYDKEISIITEPARLPQEFIDDEHAKLFQEIKEFLDPSYGNDQIKKRAVSLGKLGGFNAIENLVQKGCTEYKQFPTQ